ncbi:MAG: NAD(P)-dependent oxidoreductase [Acetobacteraceae bacterium]|nr:NAD(P)-dependent oxidoreductase [Acetobacteraceae bacterium]
MQDPQDADGTVLVTGLTGLIGSAVARRLVARGDAVIGMDRQRASEPPCDVALQEIGDAHRLHEVMQRHRIRAIVHAGGASGPMVWPESPSRVVALNVGGLVDVLEAARIHQVRRVVWFSSILAYGPQPTEAPVDEDTILRPTTVYGATKAAGEALLHAYAAEHGVDGVALRVASCYGPGRTTDCFVRLLVENALAGRPTRVPDPAARNRQHIHVDDVTDAVIAAMDAPTLPTRVYNIASGTLASSEEVAAEVARAIPGVRLEQDFSGSNWNTFQTGPLVIARARRDLGFEPRVGLAEGALSYRRWILNERNAP